MNLVRAWRAGLWPLFVPLVVLLGCAPYGKGMRPVLDSLAQGDPESALAKLEKDKRPDDALWQLERGLLLRLVGRLDESSAAFDDADRISEDLFTRSISNEAASLATSDRVRPYRPPAHELLLARYYQILNYLERSDLEGALVEARRAALILDSERDSGDGRIDRVAPLVHLVAGLTHEAAGESDVALIHYRRIFADARVHGEVLGRAAPDWLIERTWQLAKTVGVDLTGELPEPSHDARADRSRVTAVLLFEQGFVPPRIETRIDVPILASESENDAVSLGSVAGARCMEIHASGWTAPDDVEIAYWLTIALPSYGPDLFEPAWPRMETGRLMGEAIPFADVADQAQKQLRHEMPGIAVRTTIRAITKYLMQQTAKKEGGEAFGILTNILGTVTEAAETRTWLTIPHEISVAAIELSEPAETVEVHWFGDARSETLDLITIPETDIGFCLFRTWQ